jgi:hypothetical protein
MKPRKLPKQVVSLYHPTVVITTSGKYAVFSGARNGEGGWFNVPDTFTMEDALKRWKRLEVTQKPNINDAWKWDVVNSKGNGSYTVKFDKAGWNCTCPGFSFRRDCKHVQQTKKSNNL